MFSPIQLKNFINNSQSKQFNPSTSLSSQSLALIKLENLYTAYFFENIYQQLIDNSITEAMAEMLTRSFLARRWSLLKESNIAYTRAPFLPSNQLCLNLAEALAQPDEPVCQILMPTLKSLNRASYSLKEETEFNDHFALEEYMVNSDFDKLIPVRELFKQARLNTHSVFSDYQKDGAELKFQLTLYDFLALRHIAGDAGQQYMHALETYHAQCNNKQSLGFAIHHLARNLKKGSVSQLGTEETAESYLIAHTIKDFYDLWFALSLDLRTRVNTYRVRWYGDPNMSLEQYFLALFYGHPHCILNPAQIEQAKKDNIFDCIDSISNILEEFLSQYPELYTISCNEHFSQTIPDLLSLNKKAKLALKNRDFTLDGNDSTLFSSLCELFLQLPWDKNKLLEELAACVDSYENFKSLIKIANFNEEQQRAAAKHLLLTRAEILSPSCLKQLLNPLDDDAQSEVLALISKKLFSKYKPGDLGPYLRPKGYQALLTQYIPFLITSAQLRTDFIKTLRTLPVGLDVALLTALKPQLREFVSIDNIAEVLNAVSSAGQLFILNEFSDELALYTPTNFTRFTQFLSEDIKRSLALKTVTTLEISSLQAFKERLARWLDCPSMVSALLEKYKTRLNVWITDEDTLLSLLKLLTPKQASFIIEDYLDRFETLEKVCLALKYLPSTDHKEILQALPLEDCIKSIQRLKLLLTVLPLKKDHEPIIKRFDHFKLNCTRQEYDDLLPKISDDVQKIINALKTYYKSTNSPNSYSFFRSESSETSQLAKRLITQLEQNPRMDKTELQDILRVKMLEIEVHYRSRHPNSRLHKILRDFVDNSYESHENLSPSYSF